MSSRRRRYSYIAKMAEGEPKRELAVLYRYNGHGDVVQLANAAGMVTKEYDYDAFGNEKDPGTSDTNPFRYCGEYYDISSGTYYLRARYYDPTTGRFSGEDTYRGQATDPLSLNLYTYCSNNPIKYTDPMGHWQKGDRNLANWAKSLIVTATRQYNIAKANNDTAGMAQPHEHAEAIRQFMEKQRLNGIILRNLSLIHLTMIQVYRGEADKIIMLIFKKKSFTIKASSTDIIDALKTLPPTSTFLIHFLSVRFHFVCMRSMNVCMAQYVLGAQSRSRAKNVLLSILLCQEQPFCLYFQYFYLLFYMLLYYCFFRMFHGYL